VKILGVSDLHLDWRTSGFPRFDDVSRGLWWAVDVAIKRKVDLFVFLGDAMDPDSGPIVFRCMAELIGAAERLRRAGIRSFWVPGNHDAIDDGGGVSVLSPLAQLDPEFVFVADHPALHVGLPVPVLALPYPSLAADYDPARYVRDHVVLQGLEGPLLVLGHLMLRGIVPGEEATEMPRGRDVYWPLEELRKLKANVTMVGGHIHKRQVFEGVQIVGSLVKLTHGEEGNLPGILVIDV
jgi:DNA repair exonuclease SbcCD nuclease subunit